MDSVTPMAMNTEQAARNQTWDVVSVAVYGIRESMPHVGDQQTDVITTERPS